MSQINRPERQGLESVTPLAIQQIGRRIDGSLASEITLAQRDPYLYLLPNTARPIIKLERPEDWQKHLDNVSNPFKDKELTFQFRSHPRSSLVTKFSFQELLRGDWNCFYINKEGNHLPVTLDKQFGEITVRPFQGELTEEGLVKLTLLLSGEAENDKAREEVTEKFALSRVSDRFTLTEFLEEPIAFFDYFKPNDEMLVPPRLMTKDEVVNYVGQTSDILKIQAKSGKTLNIGEPGYYSYQQVQAVFLDTLADPEVNPLGVSLKLRGLKPDATVESPSLVSIHTPIAIQDHGRTLGWTIYKNHLGLTRRDGSPWEFAKFGHGNHDLFWLNQR